MKGRVLQYMQHLVERFASELERLLERSQVGCALHVGSVNNQHPIWPFFSQEFTSKEMTKN